MTTNIAKRMNSIFKKVQSLPIHKLTNSVIDKLQEQLAKRQEVAINACAPMIVWVEKQLKVNLKTSHIYPVIQINFHEFIVKDGNLDDHVNAQKKTSSCCGFQID